MKKIINDLLEENDLIIITGNDFRVYGRAKYDEDEREFVFIYDETYNEDENRYSDLYYNWNDVSIYYTIQIMKNISVDIHRQTPESKIGKRVFYIEK